MTTATIIPTIRLISFFEFVALGGSASTVRCAPDKVVVGNPADVREREVGLVKAERDVMKVEAMIPRIFGFDDEYGYQE
jgi:hypothetical protein